MITLYAFEPGFGMPSNSPFVVKTMIHLMMAKQPFVTEITVDLEAAPKGKLPYVRDGKDIIADSELIREHLERQYQVDFDPGLSASDKADAVAFTRLVEDHLYWCAMYEHWQVEENWAKMKPIFFHGLPPEQLDTVAEAIRQQLLRDLHGQGLGRHTPDELMTLAKGNLEALSNRLGDAPFWFGDVMTSADAAIAPHLHAIAHDPLSGPLNKALNAHPNLAPYAKRVLETALPDHMQRLAA